MTPAPCALLLDQVEVQLARFSEALSGKNPDELTHACAGLQPLVLTLSQSMRNSALWRADPTLSLRLKQIAAALAAHRESLMRRSVLAERALATLIPSARAETYSAGAGARRAYAGFGRQSGEFKATAA
jgi:hypothetical protein